jgi:formyl-CoA transferase
MKLRELSESAKKQETVALGNIRILDLTRVLAGPFCTMMMADLGAEVIKIEIPRKGDDTRGYLPFIGSESAYFMNINRNKKSLELNLKNPKGKKIFFELAKQSDIVIENFKPGTMDRLGLGYENLREVNKGIIYGCISGFGHYGPYRDRPGYDLIGQAMGGMMSVTGWPGSPPTRTGTAIADILAGQSLAFGILAALHSKIKTGEGQKVDISLVDSVVAAMETINQIYIVEKRIPGRVGNRYEFFYPYDSFKSKDGWFVFAVGNDQMWKRFCNCMGNDNLYVDNRFKSVDLRVKNHQKLKNIIEKWSITKKTENLVNILLEKKIPAGPIYSVDQVVNDKHIATAREMFVEVEHPKAGKTKITGSHLKLSKDKPIIKRPAPLLGEHTEVIFKELLDYTDEEILKLKEENVI